MRFVAQTSLLVYFCEEESCSLVTFNSNFISHFLLLFEIIRLITENNTLWNNNNLQLTRDAKISCMCWPLPSPSSSSPSFTPPLHLSPLSPVSTICAWNYIVCTLMTVGVAVMSALRNTWKLDNCHLVDLERNILFVVTLYSCGLIFPNSYVIKYTFQAFHDVGLSCMIFYDKQVQKCFSHFFHC